jgi:hypothetical protein
VLLAELEIRHSRAIAPTRRVALGRSWLPVEPPPGFGGILLGGLVAAHLHALNGDDVAELELLLDNLEVGRRIPQPRLRHRFQTDVVGLDRSHHRLMGVGETMWFDLDDHGRPIPQLLGAVYAAARVDARARPEIFRVLRRAIAWDGPVGSEFIAFLSGDDALTSRWRTFPTDERWALQILGFGPEVDPARDEVRSRFRDLVREAHPDHGARPEGAGQRILALTEARRILLA